MSKNENIINKIVVVAMLSALCCAGTFVQIRMPAGDFVHLGNFVMIVSALLLGGIEGGLVGSLGMGLYDVIFYTTKPSTILRTFILKFLIGFIVGFLFRLVLKKKANTKRLLFISSGVLFSLFVFSLVLFIIGDKSQFSFESGLNSVLNVNLFGSEKEIGISLYIPIFAFVFFVGTLLAGIFSYKLSKRSQAALFSISVAVLVNIIGEFFLRWLLEGFMVQDSNFTVSLITATSKIPGSVITGFVSVLLAVLIYEPIYKAVKNTSLFKDDTAYFDSVENEDDTKEAAKEDVLNAKEA